MSIYAVLVDDWEHHSTWGWDEGTRSLNGPDV